MPLNKVKISALCASFIIMSSAAFAQESSSQYPKISGKISAEFLGSSISSKDKGFGANDNTNSFAGYVNVDANLKLNLNKNWSVSTLWEYFPARTMGKFHNPEFPERELSILGENSREFKPLDNGLAIAELKLNFENEDMAASVGKITAPFGTAYRKTKRIGIFTHYFTEDYNLDEKLGGTISAIFDDSKLSFSTFLNDRTPLRRSAIHSRLVTKKDSGIAGSTSSLSSFSLTLEGGNLFGYEDWFYNLGYRNLGVSGNNPDTERETGYTASTEYRVKLSQNASFIPFFEVAKMNNYFGRTGRDALYTTTAGILTYKNWSASISHLYRSLDSMSGVKYNDKMMQYAIGYKISDNLTLDIARADVKETGKSASLLGASLNYVYKF